MYVIGTAAEVNTTNVRSSSRTDDENSGGFSIVN